MDFVKIAALFLLILYSRSTFSQIHAIPTYNLIDSSLIKQLFIIRHSYIKFNNKDTWQIYAVRLDGGSFITRTGSTLIDSTRVFKNSYHVQTYSITKEKVHLIFDKRYFQNDSQRICVSSNEYYRNGYLKKGWWDCRHSLKDYAAYKNEFTTGRRNGKFTWTFTDSNDMVRIKSKFDYKVDYPSELTFYDYKGKKEFNLMLFRDTQDAKLTTSDTIFADSSKLLGFHSYFIYRYIFNHLKDHAYLRTKDKLYYLRRNEFY